MPEWLPAGLPCCRQGVEERLLASNNRRTYTQVGISGNPRGSKGISHAGPVPRALPSGGELFEPRRQRMGGPSQLCAALNCTQHGHAKQLDAA